MQKTTLVGLLMIVAAVCSAVAHFYTSGALSASDFSALASALGGIGLVAAQDSLPAAGKPGTTTSVTTVTEKK